MKKLTSTRVFLILFATMLFLTPLLFTTATKESFEFPKMFFVYALGTTIIALFFIYRIWNWNFEFRKPNVWVLLILISVIVSTIFSEHLYTSIWGYYSRFNGGLVSLLVFIGIYFVAKNVFSKWNMTRVLMAAVFTLVPISLYGLYQYYQGIEQIRITSTLGQPNWAASYISMLLPFTLLIALTTKQTKNLKWILFGIFILSYMALWLTFSMSGLAAFLAGIGVLVIQRRKLFMKHTKELASIGFILIAFSMFNLGTFENKVKDIFIDIQKVQAQEDFTTESTTTPAITQPIINPTANALSDPGFIRINIWKGSLNLAKASPKNFIIGTGPETFPYTFQKFRPAELNYSSEWNYILNKPHNFYLEILTETGILGLISYIGLMFYALRRFNSKYTPGLVAFFVANFFGWPVVSTSLIFWMFLAGTERDYVKS